MLGHSFDSPFDRSSGVGHFQAAGSCKLGMLCGVLACTVYVYDLIDHMQYQTRYRVLRVATSTWFLCALVTDELDMVGRMIQLSTPVVCHCGVSRRSSHSRYPSQS